MLCFDLICLNGDYIGTASAVRPAAARLAPAAARTIARHHMGNESGDSNLSGIQQFVKLAVAVADADDPLLDFQEPDDSGIDSDDPSTLALQANAECSSCSDEEFSDIPCPLHDMNTAPTDHQDATSARRDALGIFRSHRPDSPDRSSPPLYEVELTASDEDDDTSVLELVIPMQSRYQRVPTSSPKKRAKRSVWTKIFCCQK